MAEVLLTVLLVAGGLAALLVLAHRRVQRAGRELPRGRTGPKEGPPLGGEEEQRFREELGRGELENVTALLRGAREGGWDERWFWIDRLEGVLPAAALEGSCGQAPDDALGFLLRGAHAARHCSDTRPGLAGAEALRRLYQERRDFAVSDLTRAAELDPADPTPHAFLIEVGRGRTSASADLQAALERDPTHFGARWTFLTFLGDRYGSTDDGLLAFAREAVESAPESDLAGLLFRAHLQRGIERDLDAVLADAAVRDELVQAYDCSLGSDGLSERRSTIHARNMAAFWFWLVRDRKRLGRELAAIGGAYTESPWGWLRDDADKEFRRARKWARSCWGT